jgi:hypothetical protein
MLAPARLSRSQHAWPVAVAVTVSSPGPATALQRLRHAHASRPASEQLRSLTDLCRCRAPPAAARSRSTLPTAMRTYVDVGRCQNLGAFSLNRTEPHTARRGFPARSDHTYLEHQGSARSPPSATIAPTQQPFAFGRGNVTAPRTSLWLASCKTAANQKQPAARPASAPAQRQRVSNAEIPSSYPSLGSSSPTTSRRVSTAAASELSLWVLCREPAGFVPRRVRCNVRAGGEGRIAAN